MASLEAGFSHDLFVEWASDTKNLVLFTERGQVFLMGDLYFGLTNFSVSHFAYYFPDGSIFISFLF